MAEQGGQEKSEQPTSKRREDARKEGNVFQSRDISTVVILLGMFSIMRLLLSGLYSSIRDYLITMIDNVGKEQETVFGTELLSDSIWILVKCVLPLLSAALLLGVLSAGAQTRFNVSFRSLKPKFSRLSPIEGFKKMFSLRNVIELIKNLIKITVLGVLLYNIIKGDVLQIARMLDIKPINSAVYMLQMIFDAVLKTCALFTVVAFFDFLYQRWDYEKNLRMTKQEVKDEYKQTEGNPEIKNRIRGAQRQLAQSRMMQKVPTADVVVRNPTHFAVALKYDPERHGAPIVIAKGQDELALRIVKIAEENEVTVLENRPLARGLYASCKLDQEIPAEFYGAVAEILVYLHRIGKLRNMFQ